MKWLCAQIGAREHYAIPRALHQMGRLQTLYTDAWASALVRKCGTLFPVKALRSLGLRWNPDLHDASVVSWNAGAAIRSYSSRRGNEFSSYIKYGSWFSGRVADHLKKSAGQGDVLFAYDTGALEAFRVARSSGVKCVLGQVDAHRLFRAILAEEKERWPEWERVVHQVPEEYHRRREQEWALADRIIANSEFSALAIASAGIRRERIAVVALAYEAESPLRGPAERPSRAAHKRLKVLFLGRVNLGKGIQYLIEAARQLADEPVEFHVVGPIGLTEEVIKQAPTNVSFHGRATREVVASWYRRSDVFVFPTLADGFGLTQIEAMSYGLPVIATPNCADVVIDGVNGIRVPIRDARAIADALRRFVRDKDFLQYCSANASRRAGEYSMQRLQSALQELDASLREPSGDEISGRTQL